MFDLITLVLTVLLLILPSLIYLNSYIKWKKLANVVNRLPGPKYVPIFGTTLSLKGPRSESFNRTREQSRKYAPLYRTWVGPTPVIHLMKPEHVELILNNSKNNDKGRLYKAMKPWLGTGLVTSTGSSWHSRRKLLTPTFHFKILEEFLEIFVERGQNMVDNLVDREYFDVFPIVKHCTLDIICKTAMGVDINPMEKTHNEYAAAIEEFTELVLRRYKQPWLKNDFIFKRTKLGQVYFKTLESIHRFIEKVIKERKEILANIKPESNKSLMCKKQRLTFLDLLLETSKEQTLSDSDIKDEVNTFMFGGHDTTSVATSFCLFLLGNHPEIQNKVYEELYAIFNDKQRPITMSDIREMKYLEMVIKESLRILPSVPGISRLIVNPVTVDDFEIPKECTVVIHIYDMHHDPKYFPDPEKFDPDRFLPENSQNRHKFAYIPFSAGARNCIGQKYAMIEEKVLLALILRKFKVTSLVKQKDLRVFSELVMHPQDGIKIKIEPRH